MRMPVTPTAMLRPDRHAVTWAFMLLAFGVAISLPWSMRETAQPVTRQSERETAMQSITYLEREQHTLKEMIADLRVRLAEAQKRQTDQQAVLVVLEQQLKEQRVMAGLTPLAGPGVVITLSDSSSNAPAGSAANDYIVHETDVRDVVNALWSAGAEAIAVNGERLVATSSIVCVGTVIIVNDTRLAPPYQITAIGDQARLVETIDTSPQLAALHKRARDLGLQFKINTGAAVETPAYKGTFQLQHARTQEDE